jgi:hypothetical protein
VPTLNEVYSSLRARRRYEVWFLRVGLADGAGAWWFRYLLMNPGRRGCPDGDAPALPVQVWATFFPREAKPQTFIQGFPLDALALSARGASPFHFRSGPNVIEEDACRGALHVGGHTVSWDLHYHSTFRVTVSHKGWIGFSRTPHSDATFFGKISLDGREFCGDPLGFGVQGHNCGYRHRNFWMWAHAYFPGTSARPNTLEALVYDMPLGLIFRKAVLWHDGRPYVFRNVQESAGETFAWKFQCSSKEGLRMEAAFDGTGPGVHRLPYLKTDCSGAFSVTNNSLARATLRVEEPGGKIEVLETAVGAVLEKAGGQV